MAGAGTCGATSIARGDGLSLSTAGQLASFSIISRDHFGNLRGASADDIYVVRARYTKDYLRRDSHGSVMLDPAAAPPPHMPVSHWLPQAGGREEGGRCQGTVCLAHQQDAARPTPAAGVYRVSYTPVWKQAHSSLTPEQAAAAVPSGKVDDRQLHELAVELAHRGGLMATYYSLPSSSNSSANDDEVNTWAQPSRTFLRDDLDDVAAERAQLRRTEHALRYRGMIEPPYAHRYTFSTSLESASDRVRVWVDNSLVVDQWASLSERLLSGTLAVDAIPSLYEIKLEYKQSNMSSAVDAPYAGPSLKWTSFDTMEAISSVRLFHAHQLPIKTSSGMGLAATYYTLPTAHSIEGATPVKASESVRAGPAATRELDWSGTSSSDRPYPSSLPDAGWKVRWAGFIIPSRTDLYTFHTPLAGSYHAEQQAANMRAGVEVSERVRLWVDDVMIVDEWSSLSALQPSGTYAFAGDHQWYNLRVDYAVVNRSQTSLNRGVTLVWENQGGRAPLLGLPRPADEDKVSKGRVPGELLMQAMVTNRVLRDDYAIWDRDWYSPTSPYLDKRVDHPEADPTATSRWDAVGGKFCAMLTVQHAAQVHANALLECAGCPSDSAAFSWRHHRCRGQGVTDNNPASVRVRSASVCADTSSVLGVALSVSTAGVTRTFTLTARDAYDNQRDEVDDTFIARAVLNDDASHQAHCLVASQPWGHVSHYPPGKYEVTYVVTRAALYTTVVHACPTMPGGYGLTGAFFPPVGAQELDQLVTRVDPSLAITWGTQGAPTANPAIPVLGFRARWTGLVLAPAPQAARHAADSQLIDFEVEADGQVALFIQGKLVASTTAGSVFASSSLGPASDADDGMEQPGRMQEGRRAGRAARGSVLLVPNVAYDIRVEYQRSAHPGSNGYMNVTWGWQGREQHEIPSTALLPTRRPVDGGRVPLVVHPNVACASTSQAYGHGLTIATAGVVASFTIISRDEYANVREDPTDMLLPRIVPRQPLHPAALDSTHLPELAYPIHLPTTAAATKRAPPLPPGRVDRPFTPFLASLGRHESWGIHKFGATRTPVHHDDLAMTREMEESLRVFETLGGNFHAFSYVTQAAGLHDIHVDRLHTAPLRGSVVDVHVVNAGTPAADMPGGSRVGLHVTCNPPCSGSGLNGSCHLSSNASLGVSYVTLSSTGEGYLHQHPPTLSCGPDIIGLELRAVVGNGNGAYASAAGQGLHATYYSTASFAEPTSSREDALADLSAFTDAASSTTGASAVWTGFLRLPADLAADASRGSASAGGGSAGGARLASATLQTHLGGDHERVKLWLDHALLIDQWSSLSSKTAVSVLPAHALGRGGQVVDVRMEYARSASRQARPIGLELKWSQTASVSNATALERHKLFAGSPVGISPGAPDINENLAGGVAGEVVRTMRVEPNIACTAASHVSGMSLTVATAGVAASFRVLIRDQYGNARANGGHEIVARLWSAHWGHRESSQALGPQVGSSYAGSGRVVAAGASLSSALLTLASNQTHLANCNMSLGQLPLPPTASGGGSAEADVRAVGAVTGRAVVFEQGLCAGRWTKIATVAASDRCMHLAPVWADEAGPCAPSPASEATSYVIATAPWTRPSMPPLQCSSCPPQVRASVHELDPAATARAAVAANQDSTPALAQAALAAAGDRGWHYGVAYTATRKGQYSVVTSLVGEAGLMATYYSRPDEVGRDDWSGDTASDGSIYGGAPVSAQAWGTQWQGEIYAVDWSASAVSGHTDGGMGTMPHSSLADGSTGFGVRWMGLLRAREPNRQYAFSASLGGDRGGAHAHAAYGGERVKLWVDNRLVIDQWSSLSAVAPSGTIGLATADKNIFDVSLLYKCANASNACGTAVAKSPDPPPVLFGRRIDGWNGWIDIEISVF